MQESKKATKRMCRREPRRGRTSSSRFARVRTALAATGMHNPAATSPPRSVTPLAGCRYPGLPITHLSSTNDLRGRCEYGFVQAGHDKCIGVRVSGFLGFGGGDRHPCGPPPREGCPGEEQPLLALWRQYDGMYDRSEAPYLRFAIWNDGRVLYAKNPDKWGHDLLRGKIESDPRGSAQDRFGRHWRVRPQGNLLLGPGRTKTP